MEINLSHTIYSTATIPDQELTIFNLTFLKWRVLPTGDFSIPWDFKGLHAEVKGQRAGRRHIHF